MRIVKQIPHDRFLIQIHQYNGKFILKIELSGFEQVFKIAETDLQDIDLIEKNLNPEFFSNCLNFKLVFLFMDGAYSCDIIWDKFIFGRQSITLQRTTFP